jgi:HKD family nuclease
MPKQFKTYTRFDGGLNTKTNSRSIQDNELAQANNVIVDELGMVKSCGKVTDNTSDYSVPSLDATVAGYGLFQATFDYNAGGTNTPTVRTFLADTDDNSDTQVDIFDAGGSWINRGTGGNIDLGSTAGGAVIYDIADGAVRVCDTNFGAGNAVKWYGYISKKLWLDSSGTQLNVGGGSVQNVTGWKTDSAPPLPPFNGTAGSGIVKALLGVNATLSGTNGGSSSTTLTWTHGTFTNTYDTELDTGLYVAINKDDGEVQPIASRTNNTVVILDSAEDWGPGADVDIKLAPDAGLGFNLEVVPTSSASFTAATYEFAQTFIYDGNQESLPTTMTGTITVGSSKYLKCAVIASHGYADRVTGGRIYCRDSTLKEEWQFLIDISLTDGCRTTLDSDYTGWSTAYSEAAYLDCTVNIGVNNVDTYATINGHSSDLSTLSVGTTGEGYKTSVVANRRKFIAYVKSVNDSGQTEVKSDRLMYSEINRFDTFPITNFIDIGTNDGESFIKLESFADRLLAFKEKTLYVINIGSGSDTQWFLESEHKNMGVEFHAATVKTDFGLGWVNKNGLYLYDGSKITNLQTKILESEWSGFVNADTMIGYEPTHKHLVVVRDAAASGATSGDAYVYSFITNSFTFVEDMVVNAVKTNIITDAYNKMTLGSALDELESYDGEPDYNTTFDIKLKDDDFGLPNIVKKIYGVTVEYSSNAVDGSSDPVTNTNGFKYLYTSDSGVKTAVANGGNLNSTAGDLDVNKITFGTPLLASSFQVQIDLDAVDVAGTNINKINNVGVEYRPIHKRIT